MQVKLPDDIMLEPDTTLASLAPVIKSGGLVPERLVASSPYKRDYDGLDVSVRVNSLCLCLFFVPMCSWSRLPTFIKNRFPTPKRG